jgi:uncharacterized protein (DUF736 family)
MPSLVMSPCITLFFCSENISICLHNSVNPTNTASGTSNMDFKIDIYGQERGIAWRRTNLHECGTVKVLANLQSVE